MMLPTTPEPTPPPAAAEQALAELARVMDGLSRQHPRILGYVTADEAGDIGLCRFAADAGSAGERSLRIFLLSQGGLLALCLNGIDPLPGIQQVLNPLLAD